MKTIIVALLLIMLFSCKDQDISMSKKEFVKNKHEYWKPKSDKIINRATDEGIKRQKKDKKLYKYNKRIQKYNNNQRNRKTKIERNPFGFH